MLFEEKYQKILKKIKPTPTFIYWIRVGVFSIFSYAFFALYIIFDQRSFNLYYAHIALAQNAFFLIGLSMALSGLCYFWNFVDTKIIYRKYLGVTGFIYGVLHGTMVIFVLNDYYQKPDFFLKNKLPIFFSSASLVLFLFMILISNKRSIHELGGAIWRKTIRYVGYAGFIFVIIHTALLRYDEWLFWFQNFNFSFLPPMSLILTLYALGVLFLRMNLWFFSSRERAHIAKSSVQNTGNTTPSL